MVSLASLGPVFAQTQRGEISGRVSDTSGAVIPKANIALTNTDTGVTLTTNTDDAGIYVIPNIQYGAYTLKVSGKGFETTTVTGIRILSASTTAEDVVLKVGTVATQVVVEAKATALQTATSVVATNVENKLIEDIPNLVNGGMRSPWSYVYMTPGVDPQGQLTVAGGRTDTTEVLLDGQTADLDSSVMGAGGGGLPSVEATGEFKMVLNSMPAEYGRSSGGEITYASKSGTSEFHGSLYEYVRNDDLDARPWQAATVSPEKQNEFGVAVGGPVIIPKLYNGKNKTFFWATLTGYRLRTAPATGVLTMPTAAMRNGDFTAPDLNPIYDPLSLYTGADGNVHRAQFSCNGVLNTICQDRFSHVSQFFLNKFPLPNRSGDFDNFVGSAPSLTNNWDGTAKVDEYIGAKDRLAVFFQWSHPYSSSGNFVGPEFDSVGLGGIYRPRVDWTHTFGPNLINEFEIGATRQTSSSQYANYGQNYGKLAGLTGTLNPNCPGMWFDYPQGFSLCDGQPATTSAHLITTINDTLSWVKGSHEVKMGAEFIRWNENSADLGGPFQASAAGEYNFYQGGTADTNSLGGNTMASFLLGYPSGTGYTTSGGVNMAGPLVLGIREAYLALFVEDSWKVTRRLTINAGLRWDLNLPYSEVHGQETSLDLTEANPGATGLDGALTFYGQGPGRNGTNRPGLTHWKDFGPRLGLAYRLDHASVFRAFGGLIYQGIQDADAEFADRTGFQASGSPPPNVNPYGLYYDWDTPYPTSVIGTVPFTNPAFRNGQAYAFQSRSGIGVAPQLYMYSAALERQIPGNILITATYMANIMRHASDQNPIDDLNPQYWSLGALLNQPLNSAAVQAAGFKSPFPQFNANLPLVDALLPYPQYLGLQDDASDRTGGDYHSGVFQAQKHLSNGLSFLFSYTIAKNISDTTWAPGAYGSSPRDPYDRHLEKLIARFDTPQTVVLSYSYEFPFGRGKKFLGNANRVTDALAGGWVFAGTHRIESGTPVPIGGAQSQAIPGGIGVQPDRNPGVPVRSRLACSQMVYLNPAKDYLLNAGNAAQAAATGRPLAYIPEGDFQLGNAPDIEASARECGNESNDVSLFKDVPVTQERVHIRIGADAFNVFNRHSWQVTSFGSNTTTDPHFGEIVPFQVEGPRVLQLHVRLQF